MRGRLPRTASLMLAAMILALVVPADAVDPGSLVLISRSSDGTGGDGASSGTAMSSDGRHIAFASVASNLVSDDTNGIADVFVHDRRARTTRRVSVASDGRQAEHLAGVPLSATAMAPVISADGSVVVFWSRGTDLDPDGRGGIFAHDLASADTTFLLDVIGSTTALSLSSDGDLIAFDTPAPLVASDTNGLTDVYVFDRAAGTLSLVSVDVDGIAAGGRAPSLAADAPIVAYETLVVPARILVRDVASGETRVASLSWQNQPANASSVQAALAGDGSRVAFRSAATNLVPGDHNSTDDIFVRDLDAAQTIPVSLAADGRSSNGPSSAPRLSHDGSRVLFTSRASNLVSADTNGTIDVFLRDLDAVETTRVSLTAAGLQIQGVTAEDHALSGDGSTIAFATSDPATEDDADDVVVDIFAAGPALPPGVPVIASPAEGELLDAASVLVAGTADRGDTVTVAVDGTPAAQTAVAGDGTWSLTLTLGASTHALTATASDGIRTSAPSPARTISVRLDPPPAPIIHQPIEGTLLGAAPAVVAGAARPGSTVTISESGAAIGSVVADQNGSWRTTIAFIEGPHGITATATNDYGTGPASPLRRFNVDATAPAAPTLTTPSIDELVETRLVETRLVTLTGTGEPGARLDISGLGVGIAGVTAASDGAWNTQVTLQNGAYTAAVVAVDQAGNRSETLLRSFRVAADVTRPLLTITTTDPALLALDAIAVDGVARDDRIVDRISVRFTDQAGQRTTVLATCDGCGSLGEVLWSAAPDLAPGLYEVRVIAYDTAGNGSLAQSIRAIRV